MSLMLHVLSFIILHLVSVICCFILHASSIELHLPHLISGLLGDKMRMRQMPARLLHLFDFVSCKHLEEEVVVVEVED